MRKFLAAHIKIIKTSRASFFRVVQVPAIEDNGDVQARFEASKSGVRNMVQSYE